MEERTVVINGRTRKIVRRTLKGGKQTFNGKITKRLDGKNEETAVNVNETTSDSEEEEERICQICHKEMTDCDLEDDICNECKHDQWTKWVRYLDGDGGYIGFLK